VLKYLDDYKRREPVEKIRCYLLDKEQAWADTWTELDESLNSEVSLNANFQPFDVSDPTSWESQRKFLQAELFTISYFVSEIFSLDREGMVTAFWDQLFEGAKPGALFLYVDNGHADFNTYFDARWQAAGLECLIAEDNMRIIPRSTEQAAELATYNSKFERNPKIQAFISYRVLRKR